MNYCEHAIVLAGGKSTRMGEDKALLPFGSYKTLAEFQYNKLQKHFKNVYISTKEDKFDFDAPLLYDMHKDSSPLVAILSIFEVLKIDSIFILSVDVPFVSQEVIDKIIQEDKDKYDVLIAQSPSGIQPLCGLYKKSILLQANKQYKKRNHKLKDLLSCVNVCHVFFEVDEPFANINHPIDYKDALEKQGTKN